jgi:hypothetical protein
VTVKPCNKSIAKTFQKINIERFYLVMHFDAFSPCQWERVKLRIRSYNDLQQFQSFGSLDELNHSVKSFKEFYSDELNYSDLALIDILSQYSVKYMGVCYLKNKTLCDITERSESTIERSKRKLKKLGFITTVKTTRGVKCPGQGANVMVIQPFKLEIDKPMDNPCDNGIIKTLDQTQDKVTDLNKRKEVELDHTFVNDQFVHPYFIKIAKCFVDKQSVINSLWSKVKLAAYKNNMESDSNVMINVATYALKMTIGQLKRKRLNNVMGYFYTVLNAKFEARYYDQYFEDLEKVGFDSEPVEGHWLFF